MLCEHFKTPCEGVTSFTDARELGAFVLNEILRRTSSHYALITFLDPDTQRLVVEVSRGFKGRLPPTRWGHGPMGIAMARRETVSGEYSDFPHVLPELSQEMGPVIVVPMLFGGKVVGAIGVGRRKGEVAYSSEKLEMVEGLVCTVTPIFVYMRYYSRNRLRNRRISAINRLFARLIRAEDEAKLLDESLLHATRLFSADAAAAMLVCDGRPVVVRSLGMARPPTTEEMERGLTREVLNTRKGVRLRSYMDHPKAVKEFCKDTQVGSLMLEPLLESGGGLLGAFWIHRKREKPPFLNEDEAEFRLFCHHVGLALEQKRLLHRLEQQVAIKEAVFQHIQNLLTESDVEPHEVVASLLEKAFQLLGADFAGYHVWVPARGVLDPYHQMGFDFKLPAMRLGEGLAGMAVAKKDVVVVTRYENEVIHNGSRKKYGALVQSAISVPLIYRGDVLGTITLGRGYKKAPFEERDVSALRLFGAVASSILGYARTFQEAQKRSERLDQVQRLEALGTLGVGIAHDFNNVLTGIIGYLEMAKEDLQPSHPAYFGIEGAMKLVDRATALAKQILSVAGRGGGEQTVFDPAPQLKELVKMAHSTFPKNIYLHLDLPKKVPSIYADPTQFHQVVLNLLVNAKDAMPEGGEIRLMVREREILDRDLVTHPELEPGNYLVISVSDTGRGIPESEINRIFEPGFTTKEEGTGWGLFTVFSIVKNLGGTVTVYSQEGVGSTFRVYLPVAQSGVISQREKDRVSENASKRTGGRNLLVVDDEESLLENTKLLLERLGYRVVTASTGNKAIEIYRQHWRKIDGVVLDMVMPGMNGLEVFMAMKQINPDVRVLLVSGHAKNGLLDKAFELGVKGFLVKPYTSKELADSIEEVFVK